jgi:hypothetical protein
VGSIPFTRSADCQGVAEANRGEFFRTGAFVAATLDGARIVFAQPIARRVEAGLEPHGLRKHGKEVLAVAGRLG